MSIWNQNNSNNMMMGQAQFNPYQPTAWNQYAGQRLPVYNATPIHGENAAWQFPMGPNSEIWLPDADKDLVWWIRTDNMGNKNIKPFKLNDYEEPQPVDMNDLAARVAAVEEWINGKQNKSNAKRNVTQSANAATTNVIPTTVE